jgi:hypothetical protein
MIFPNIITRIYAKNPVTILITLGGLGWMASIKGAGTLLFIGVLLQLAWLFVKGM